MTSQTCGADTQAGGNPDWQEERMWSMVREWLRAWEDCPEDPDRGLLLAQGQTLQEEGRAGEKLRASVRAEAEANLVKPPALGLRREQPLEKL